MTQRGMNWHEWRWWNRTRPIAEVWREFRAGVEPAVLRAEHRLEASVLGPSTLDDCIETRMTFKALGPVTAEDVRHGWHPGPFRI